MKKPFIIGTVAALTIANTGVTGIASTLDNPRQEAEHVIVDQVPADEQEIQERGPAYADEFLAAFRQLSTTYEQAFRQGVADAEQGYRRAPGGSNLVEVAYQRGWERGQQLIAAASPVVPQLSRQRPLCRRLIQDSHCRRQRICRLTRAPTRFKSRRTASASLLIGWRPLRNRSGPNMISILR